MKGQEHGNRPWLEIESLFCLGVKVAELSEKFGISSRTIASRASRKGWIVQRKKIETELAVKRSEILENEILNRQKFIIETQYNEALKLKETALRLLSYGEREKDKGLIGEARKLYETALTRLRQSSALPERVTEHREIKVNTSSRIESALTTLLARQADRARVLTIETPTVDAEVSD